MPTFTVQMQNNRFKTCIFFGREQGFVLAEMLAVITILGLMVGMAMVSQFGLLTRSRFKSQVQDFISTMEMAARSAAENGKRYEVVIDISAQEYFLREITDGELFEIYEDQIIEEREFSNDCRVMYVKFDDGVGTDANHQQAKFRVGPFGWQYGGKVVFMDANENFYSVLVNRISRIIELRDGDVELLMPRTEGEL